MSKLPITGMVILMLISISIIGGIASTYNQVTELDITSDTGNTLITPFNISLSEIPVTVLNVTNGSITIPSDNYTIFATEKQLQINSNETFTENNITVSYNYKPSAYISGFAKSIFTLVIAILIFGVVFMVTKINR